MKIGLFLFILLTGCSFLRYNYEVAVAAIPKNSQIRKITNDYVEYDLTNSVFRSYYSCDGKIYKTIIITNICR